MIDRATLDTLTGLRLGPYRAHNPVSRTQVWQWCRAMGDANPLYLQGERVIAPPAMMQMWTMRDINNRYAPGSTTAAPYRVFDELTDLGYPSNVAVSYDIRFHRYLEEGEAVSHYTTVVHISDEKQTALGQGFFVTEKVEYLAGEQDGFAEALITYFQYRALAGQDSGTDTAAAVSNSEPRPPHEGTESDGGELHPEREGCDWSGPSRAGVAVGERLPALSVPITHRLVVGGAIATQDYIPVHHNVRAAQGAGMPDVFMNILTTSGLVARYLGDWGGQHSRLRALSFKLLSPNFPGDTMALEGTVTAVEHAASSTRVALAFAGRNGLGFHTTGTAELTLAG